jgi:membrane protein DedA with SNARE-associated domain
MLRGRFDLSRYMRGRAVWLVVFVALGPVLKYATDSFDSWLAISLFAAFVVVVVCLIGYWIWRTSRDE